MSSGLIDAVARIARHEVAARAVAAIGVVTDAFTDADHAVTVELRDTKLVLPRVPVAVGLLGFAAIPSVGDLVLVLFCEGDRNAPVVVGRLYHPDLDPPEHAKDRAVLALPAGVDEPAVRLSVEAATPKITLDLPGDVHMEIGDGVVHLDVGPLHTRLDASGGGRVEVAAGGSSITLKQDGDITIKAVGNLTLEGTEVKVKGTAKVSVKGAVVELN